MPVEIHHTPPSSFAEIELQGTLRKEDYADFVPRLDALIEEHGPLRLVVRLEGFHGWTAGALWEDVKFDLRHFADFERLALVGDSRWEKGMAVFCKPFTRAQVRYFETGSLDDARQWAAAD